MNALRDGHRACRSSSHPQRERINNESHTRALLQPDAIDALGVAFATESILEDGGSSEEPNARGLEVAFPPHDERVDRLTIVTPDEEIVAQLGGGDLPRPSEDGVKPRILDQSQLWPLKHVVFLEPGDEH